MTRKTILCIEDNKKVQTLNKLEFEDRGYAVELAMTLHEARRILSHKIPDLIILDINMPDGNGLEFLRELRASGPEYLKIPVLILTGYGNDSDVVTGFESGCNDYMVKPYTFPVLFMRAKELLHRAEQMPESIDKGFLKLDIVAGQALLNKKDLLLTQKDFALLLLFTQNENKLMSTDYLYEKVWNTPMNGNTQAIKSAISRLRKKIDGSGYSISSVRGKGYLFESV